MEIRSLELKNYRNYNSQQVFFDKGVNVLVGKNAQGKTNMLESITAGVAAAKWPAK